MLQERFAEIHTICAPNFYIEAASPNDLTFAKIAEEVQGHAFQLDVWAHTVNLKDMERIDRTKREVVEKASRTLSRLLKTITRLKEECGRARPRDLKMQIIPQMGDDSDWESDEDGDVDR